MFIDSSTYNKILLYPPAAYDALHRGYGAKRGKPKSLVIHTTNGKKGTTLQQEANFLYRSREVSAHYLVGKNGEYIQFLDPVWSAYHAGAVFPTYRYYGNPYSIGIECHHALEEPWSYEQKQGLFDLCRHLIFLYDIKLVETHRRIARPDGRKVDPSDFLDSEFYSFVKRLLYDSVLEDYKTIVNTNLRSKPNTQASIIEILPKGRAVDVAEFLSGESYAQSDQWARLVTGGYIWKNLLVRI